MRLVHLRRLFASRCETPRKARMECTVTDGSSMKSYPIDELTLDLRVYPRREIDRDHVFQIKQAMQLGVKFPPIVICRKSKRIADGFHRITAMRDWDGCPTQADCIEKDYANDQELFLDAVRLNAGHGKAFTVEDKAACALRADKLKIDSNAIARELFVNRQYLADLLLSAKADGALISGFRQEDSPSNPAMHERKPYRRNPDTASAPIGGGRPAPAANYIDSSPRIQKSVAAGFVNCTSDDPQKILDLSPLSCARRLVALFEAGKVVRGQGRNEGRELQEQMEILNWHIEEVFGFSAK